MYHADAALADREAQTEMEFDSIRIFTCTVPIICVMSVEKVSNRGKTDDWVRKISFRYAESLIPHTLKMKGVYI